MPAKKLSERVQILAALKPDQPNSRQALVAATGLGYQAVDRCLGNLEEHQEAHWVVGEGWYLGPGAEVSAC